MEHFEDIIIRKGPQAALKAIDDLLHVSTGMMATTTKFDGSPSITFARDHLGQFMFNDKNRFRAKTYDGKAKSREHIKETILRRKQTDSQIQYAEMMAKAWDVLEESTDGLIEVQFEADVLWLPEEQSRNSHIKTRIVKPNLVEYHIPSTVFQSLGIVIHSGPINRLRNNHALWWQGQEKITLEQARAPSSIRDRLKEVQDVINIEFSQLALLHFNRALCQQLYSFNCRNVDFSDNMAKEFFADTTIPRELRATVLNATMVINTLNGIKNDMVHALETQRAIDGKFPQYFDGKFGGEGFVVGEGDTAFKLVKRNFRTR